MGKLAQSKAIAKTAKKLLSQKGALQQKPSPTLPVQYKKFLFGGVIYNVGEYALFRET
jgi:hypothetical protein